MIGERNARMRLILVRHGRASDVEGRCIGHTDLALSSEGAAAIQSACSIISSAVVGSVRVVSSDLRRALDSAAIVAGALRVAVDVDPRLREMSFGDWDGRHWSDLERNDGDRLRAWADGWTTESPPNGESVADLHRRAADWLRDSTTPSSPDHDHDRDRTIVVVSHAGWIRVAVSVLLDRQLERLFEIPVDYAQATIIDCQSARSA